MRRFAFPLLAALAVVACEAPDGTANGRPSHVQQKHAEMDYFVSACLGAFSGNGIPSSSNDTKIALSDDGVTPRRCTTTVLGQFGPVADEKMKAGLAANGFALKQDLRSSLREQSPNIRVFRYADYTRSGQTFRISVWDAGQYNPHGSGAKDGVRYRAAAAKTELKLVLLP